MERVSKISVGQKGEAAAERFLKKKGYDIVTRNYRCKLGEMDLVAKKGGCLVFLEIRSTRTPGFIHPLETITPKKKLHIQRTAQHFLARNPYEGWKKRIDVICVIEDQQHGKGLEIEHIENAFDCPS